MIVNPSLFIGGAEIVIKNLCYNLNPEIFNISVCHLKERGVIGDELCNSGFDVVGIPKSTFMEVDYFTSIKLLKLIRDKNIDLVHSHATHPLTDATICKIFSFLFLKHIRVVHTFHFGNYPYDKKSRMFLEFFFGRFTDKLVAVGNFQKRQLQNTYNFSGSRITTIWNGISQIEGDVDSKIIQFIKESDSVVVGTIGTLFEQKGITYLIDTAAALKKRGHKLIFVVAGEGPLRRELEKKCKILNLENNVYFLGWVQNASKTILPHIDIFFQPSLWEAMSVVILEAMMMAKPIVATNVGENSYILENSVDGLIVEPKAVDQMVEALDKLINDIDLRKKLGNAARKKYEKYFTALSMAKRYEQLYIEVLRKNDVASHI